jgi:hypothetical protein
MRDCNMRLVAVSGRTRTAKGWGPGSLILRSESRKDPTNGLTLTPRPSPWQGVHKLKENGRLRRKHSDKYANP